MGCVGNNFFSDFWIFYLNDIYFFVGLILQTLANMSALKTVTLVLVTMRFLSKADGINMEQASGCLANIFEFNA